MRKTSVFFILLLALLATGTVLVSCDNGTTSGTQTSFEGTWLVIEIIQAYPPPGRPYDMSNRPPKIYMFRGDTYQVYFDGNLDEEGTFILYDDNPYKDKYKNDPQYNDSSYMEFDNLRFNYNGMWLDSEKGPWLWDEKRIQGRFYRFIDQDTVYLFEGYSTQNITLKRQ